MTDRDVENLARHLDSLTEQVSQLTTQVATLTAKREEWERQQGLGNKTQAALIAVVGGLGAAIGGALVTAMVGA